MTRNLQSVWSCSALMMLAGCVALLVWIEKCQGFRTINRLVTNDYMRSGGVSVWVVTNRITQSQSFALVGLDAGYVPILGETQFSSIAEVAKAIGSLKYGLLVQVFPEYLGSDTDDRYSVRALTKQECDQLRSPFTWIVESQEGK